MLIYRQPKVDCVIGHKLSKPQSQSVLRIWEEMMVLRKGVATGCQDAEQ